MPVGQHPAAAELADIQSLYATMAKLRPDVLIGDFNYDETAASAMSKRIHWHRAPTGMPSFESHAQPQRVRRKLDYIFLRGNTRTAVGKAFVRWTSLATDHRIIGTLIRLKNAYVGPAKRAPRKPQAPGGLDPHGGGTPVSAWSASIAKPSPAPSTLNGPPATAYPRRPSVHTSPSMITRESASTTSVNCETRPRAT
jgi:hypothetical protein